MSAELLTVEQVAANLQMHPVTVRDWRREGRIKEELMIGRSPRFDIKKVRKQIIAYNEKKAKEKFKGMVPTY